MTGAWRRTAARERADTGQPDDVRGDLLHCRWADLGDRCLLGVLASFICRKRDHVQPVVITTGRRDASGYADKRSGVDIALGQS